MAHGLTHQSINKVCLDGCVPQLRAKLGSSLCPGLCSGSIIFCQKRCGLQIPSLIKIQFAKGKG